MSYTILHQLQRRLQRRGTRSEKHQRSTVYLPFLSLFLVPVERQCVPFARYDSNKGSARSLQKLQRAIVYFFYCCHVRVMHIIISHKRCINSRFRILYTYFRSSYCRLLKGGNIGVLAGGRGVGSSGCITLWKYNTLLLLPI